MSKIHETTILTSAISTPARCSHHHYSFPETFVVPDKDFTYIKQFLPLLLSLVISLSFCSFLLLQTQAGIQCLPLWVWLNSFSIILSKLICVVHTSNCIPFYGWIIFYCTSMPHFLINLFILLGVWVFLPFAYYLFCCYEYLCTGGCLSLLSFHSSGWMGFTWQWN